MEEIKMTKKSVDKEDINIVLYHGSCSDGYGSAFVVWLYYKNKYGLGKANEIQYIPCYHQKDLQLAEDFLNNLKNKNVLMCDFSYKYDQLVNIRSVVNSFMILDHHKTAEADLLKISKNLKIFDMNRSGCGITWDFFYPDVSLPKFLQFIQDRDLWTHKLKETSNFVAFFYEQDFNFEYWEEFLSDEKVDSAIEIGASWLEYKNILVDKVVKRTSYIIQEINGQYAIVLYSNSVEFKSDVGNAVFKKIPIGDFSCVWDYDLYRDQTLYSLRSTDDRFDVSTIAKKFGGGGHRNASGLSFTGIVGCLPFNKIDDPDLLKLLLHNTKGTLSLNNDDYTYTLFRVRDVRDEWFEENYFDLLKRKCSDSILLVFEKDSDQVNVIDDSIVVPLKQYIIFYNEKSLKQPEKQLQFIVCAEKGSALIFESSKEFHEVFWLDPKTKNSENKFSEDDNDDNDDNDEDESDDWSNK